MIMDFEELIYDYGHTMYKLGRLETDGKETTKEYTKFLKRKEELKNYFDSHFKGNNKKLSNTLGLI
jgi:hypothetical protein